MTLHKTYTYTIRNTETDIEDKIHYQALFSMLQESASLDADVYGWGAEEMDKRKLCWLLLRVSVRMEKMPSWLDTIHIETWSRGADRLYFFRDFVIRDDFGHVLGNASSVWIVVEKEAHRPVRPSMLMEYERTASDPSQVFDFDPPKITSKSDEVWLSSEDEKSIAVKFADFTEIDRNRHVNNTRYVAWAIDAFYKKQSEICQISGIDINFISEIKYGSKIFLFSSVETDTAAQIDGYVQETKKPAFSAVVHYLEKEQK